MLRTNQETLDEYLTMAQVASVRGCSRAWVHKLVQDGRMPVLRVAGVYVAHREDAVRDVEDKRLGRPKLERGDG